MQIRLLALSLTASLCWSISAVLGKKLLHVIAPKTFMTLTSIMFAGAMLCATLVSRDAIARDWPKIKGSTAIWALLLGVLAMGFLVPYWIYYSLMQQHSAFIVTALTYTAPLFVVVGSVLFLNEPLEWTAALGVSMIVGGALLCAYK